MSKIKCTVDLPFPEIKIDRMSKHDVCCLLEDFGGRASETTAVMQYIYQAYITCEIEGEWHDLFQSIAMAEMQHHKQIGMAISKLGGIPVIGGCRDFWSGFSVDYTRDLCRMIEIDIDGEKAAIMHYKKTIECLENYSCRELIERIIKDEELHLELLCDALKHAKSLGLCCH